MFWPKLTKEKIKLKVFEALGGNESYMSRDILGVSYTLLDEFISPEKASFLRDQPFLSTVIANPNHIGCHTIDAGGEEIFSGTQQIEKDLIRICAEEIFKAPPNSCDGYVATGGTEANIEALWVFRNYFIAEENAVASEIGIVYSEDCHYSIPKAANLLGVEAIQFGVHQNTREVNIIDLENKLKEAVRHGINYFIVVANVSSVMFGSVDDIDKIANAFVLQHLNFKLHIDATFGGFIYPFTNADSKHNFANPHVSSIALDANRILQAPYGTGIFLIRKNFLKHVITGEVTYVKQNDHTLCGSRSGALPVAVWMILHAYGSTGWTIKMNQLKTKTEIICEKLRKLEIEFYHNPYVNSIAIKSKYISKDIAQRFYLVPDAHDKRTEWYKITINSDTRQPVIDEFMDSLNSFQDSK